MKTHCSSRLLSLLSQLWLQNTMTSASWASDLFTVGAIHIWLYTESIRANQFPLSVLSIFIGAAFLLEYAIDRRSILEDNQNNKDRGQKAGLRVVRRLGGSWRAHTTSHTRRRKRDTIFGAFRCAHPVDSINTTRSGSELR